MAPPEPATPPRSLEVRGEGIPPFRFLAPRHLPGSAKAGLRAFAKRLGRRGAALRSGFRVWVQRGRGCLQRAVRAGTAFARGLRLHPGLRHASGIRSRGDRPVDASSKNPFHSSGPCRTRTGRSASRSALCRQHFPKRRGNRRALPLGGKYFAHGLPAHPGNLVAAFPRRKHPCRILRRHPLAARRGFDPRLPLPWLAGFRFFRKRPASPAQRIARGFRGRRPFFESGTLRPVAPDDGLAGKAPRGGRSNNGFAKPPAALRPPRR